MPATFSNFTPVSGWILMAQCLSLDQMYCTTQFHNSIPNNTFHNGDKMGMEKITQFINFNYYIILPFIIDNTLIVLRYVEMIWAAMDSFAPSVMICALPWFPSPGMAPPRPWERKKSKPRHQGSQTRPIVGVYQVYQSTKSFTPVTQIHKVH